MELEGPVPEIDCKAISYNLRRLGSSHKGQRTKGLELEMKLAGNSRGIGLSSSLEHQSRWPEEIVAAHGSTALLNLGLMNT
nr:hypothetical protein CFP56_26569 [Quercus suber]